MTPLRVRSARTWLAIPIAVFLGGALWASFAAAAAPVFSSLPVGQISRTPSLSGQPEQVPAGEKVTGFHPALPPAGQMAHAIEGTRYITVFSTEEAARQHSQGGLSRAMAAAVGKIPGVDKEPPPLSCFVAADQYHLKADPQPWPTHVQEQLGIHGAVRGSPAAKQFQGATVRALHQERLERDGPDRATLHMTDVWLDPTTLGVRLVGKTKLTLAQVAAGPAGVKVFAARNDDGEALHFVVQVPRPDGQGSGYWGRHLMASVGNQSTSSDCGHVRLELPTMVGVGERARVQVEIALSSPEPVHGPAAGGAAAAGTATASPMAPGGGKEIRLRTLLVHLGVSQTATDSEPVVTVSFGWLGRQRVIQMY